LENKISAMSIDDINPFMDEKDAEKFFDDSKYTTLLINTEEFSHKNKQRVSDLVTLITSSERESKDEALKLIKAHEGKELLLEAVAQPEFKSFRAPLIAACWESGIDFTEFFEFFLHLALVSDYAVTLEAITVIENMEGKISDDILKLGKEKIAEGIAKNDEKKILLQDLLENLEQR
jgi:hypothetical protein